MVSTRSADRAQSGAAVTHGEVNSAGRTPRRSGRTRSSGGAAATPVAEQPPSTAARGTRSRRQQLAAIQEEQQEQQAVQQEEEAVQQEEEGQHSPRVQRRARESAAAHRAPAGAGSAEAGAASGDEDEGEGAQALTADASVVDLLAQEMFAALDGAFGQPSGGGSASSSEPDSEDEPQQRQQQPPAGSQQAGREEPAADGESSSSEEDSDGEDAAGDQVPPHLRWRPDLLLPGMGPQEQERQPLHGRPLASGGGQAAAPGMQAVQRSKDSLRVAPVDSRAQLKAARKEAPDTAGGKWFDLPATKITDEVKNDLRLLRLRGALDPKSFYKKLDTTKFPKYFQMGTVVEGPADYYSGRLTNKQRKRTLTEEIMADEKLTQLRKKRYTKLQEERTYWSKKKAGRKTDNERRPKAHHRPKH